MSADNRFLTESIEELLVAIADGVREAQEALSEAPPLDAYGRALPTYHLPYLDFNINVEMETVSSSTGRPIVRLLGKNSGSSKTTKEASSSIAGRLVAIPPSDGLPVPLLTISSKKTSLRRHKIIVTAINSAGEILSGQGVELNINSEASKKLSEANGIAFTSKRAGTKVSDAILVTNEEGKAESTLSVDAGLAEGTVLVLTAELGSHNVNLSVSVGGG